MARFVTRPGAFLLVLLLLASGVPVAESDATPFTLQEPVVVRAAAVALTDAGLQGSIATISVSVAEGGSGHIFMDTLPLAQVDMQGSARIAVNVASVITGLDTDNYDFFFVIRSHSQIIGGPSAGAIMAVGTIAALKGWDVRDDVMMTGTVNPDGSVGPVGGIPEKAAAAASRGASVFLYPEGQENAPRGNTVVDVNHYCERELSIRCHPVADVEAAVTLATGHEFERAPLTGNVTDAEFKRVMQPLAAELYGNATQALAEAEAAFGAAGDAIPPAVREQTRARLDNAGNALADAQAALDAERYYTTASKSFQASIAARFGILVAGAYTAADAEAYLDDRFADVDALVTSSGSAARDAEGLTATRLQAVGAAQVRASEAEAHYATAAQVRESAQDQDDLVAMLDSLAWAEERARTVTWWLGIGDRFTTPSQELSPEDVERAARETVTTAQESLIYAEVILMDAGGDAVLGDAQATLQGAREDLEAGYHASAMFNAVEAEVRANLLIELLGYRGDVPDTKLESARAGAERAILEARERNAEPILAVAYYEFAGDVEGPAARLEFYSLARTIARLTEYLGAPAVEPRASRFVGDAAFPPPVPVIPLAHGAAYFATGLALGVLATAVVILVRDERAPRPPREGDAAVRAAFPYGGTPPPPPPPPRHVRAGRAWSRDPGERDPPPGGTQNL